MKFSVEFTINRLTLRLQHRAAELAAKYQLGNVLFPTAPAISSQTELPKLRLAMLKQCVDCICVIQTLMFVFLLIGCLTHSWRKTQSSIKQYNTL